MHLLMIPLAAVAVWPAYAWVSRRSPARRVVRFLLGCIVAVSTLVLAAVGLSAFFELPDQPGKFDDAMYVLVFLGGALLLFSVCIGVLGETAVWLNRRKGRLGSGA